MTRILDYRLRPPLPGIVDLGIWNPAGMANFHRMQGIEICESARTRSMDLFWRDMREAGIAIGVLNGRQLKDHRGFISNETLYTITQEYPGVFYALCGANPFLGAENVKDAELHIRERGFKGIALDPALYQEPLLADHERLFPYYEVCLKYDYPAVLTIGPTVGPDISYSSPVQVDRLAARFPELKIVVSHGCWPWTNEICGVVARRRNVYLMPDMYYFGLPGEDDYTKAIQTFAEDQFIFATAYPSRPLQLAVSDHRGLKLKPGVFEKIMYQNAAKLLKLES